MKSTVVLILLCMAFIGMHRLLADVQQWVPDALIVRANNEYGAEAAARVLAWQQVLQEARGLSEMEQLQVVNQFFNDQIPFRSDISHWQQDDYWATPFESLVTHGGDCEDYVIAKYYSLLALGVDVNKLRITYVKAVRLNEAHMVLTYFPTPDAIPLVLDNLIDPIASASQRPDLVPVYSFNAQGMWLERMKGEGIRMGNPNNLDLWTDLRLRMHADGMNL
ncbi:MAG: transglutaminase-like cysteine peptidase [Bacterioplanes sp.]|nr:transglutaminase-like cysteine peptidase [Bacterioplanes sp.]